MFRDEYYSQLPDYFKIVCPLCHDTGTIRADIQGNILSVKCFICCLGDYEHLKLNNKISAGDSWKVGTEPTIVAIINEDGKPIRKITFSELIHLLSKGVILFGKATQ